MPRNADDPKPKSPPVRTTPLNPPELEDFVRIYRDTFDGAFAAQKAGYQDAANIWPDLLAHKDVQARLRYYRAGVDVPARTSTALFDHLFTKAFGGLGNVLVPDVITGEIRIDWEQALAQDAAAIEFDQTISDRGGIMQRTTRLRKRNSLDALQVVTRNLKEIEDESKVNSFAQAMMHMMETAESMPIAQDDPAERMARYNRGKAYAQPAKPTEEDDDPEP